MNMNSCGDLFFCPVYCIRETGNHDKYGFWICSKNQSYQVFLLNSNCLPVNIFTTITCDMVLSPAQSITEWIISYTHNSNITFLRRNNSGISLVTGCKPDDNIFAGFIFNTL